MNDSAADIVRLEAAMEKKFGVQQVDTDAKFYGYTTDLYSLQPLIENHPNWSMKRMGGHRWEVRNGAKDKAYYGKTLAIAICKALLEMP